MAVEGVNNNNYGYATSAAILGGATGAGIGYATKSILKDGNYTDEFVKSVGDKMLSSDKGKLIVEMMKIDEKSPNYLTQMIDVLKKHHKVLGINPNDVTKTDVELAEMFGGSEKVRELVADAKSKIAMKTGEILTTGENTNVVEAIKRQVPKDLDEVFDKAKGEFKAEVKEEAKDVLEFAKKAQRNIKLKAAGIYGAVGAAILGLGAYLFTNSKSDDVQA